MAQAELRLLIISRDALLDHEESPSSEEIFRLLAYFTRRGVNVLLTAPEPDHWVPTRGTVDAALDNQKRLQERIRAAGGEFEGVYYVPRSLLTQNRNREGALQDILKRYSLSAREATLISASIPFLKAASRLGIRTHEVNSVAAGDRDLRSALERVRRGFL
jgi:hypothetical protein